MNAHTTTITTHHDGILASPIYADLLLALAALNMHVNEDNGTITLTGKLSDIPTNAGYDGEPYYTPLAKRIVDDIQPLVGMDATIAIHFNAKRLIYWRNDTELAGRLHNDDGSLAIFWHDLLVLSIAGRAQAGGAGAHRKGTYHFTRL